MHGSAQGLGNDVFSIGLSIDCGSLDGVSSGPVSDLTPGLPGLFPFIGDNVNQSFGLGLRTSFL